MMEWLDTGKAKEINIPGYVCDSEILKRIDNISHQSFGEQERTTEGARSTYVITDSDNKDSSFNSLESFLDHLNSESSMIHAISLKYVARDSGINIVFNPQGNITLSSNGGNANFRFEVDRLERVIHECDPEYGSLVRILVFRPWLRKSIGWSLVAFSSILLLSLALYAYARKVGVNVDPNIIPSGNVYFQDVERAIKSNDTNEKLNVMLKGQLQGFSNVRDVLQFFEMIIAISSIALLILLAGSFVRWRIVQLYPITFFAFGHQKQVLTRLQRKREIWLTVVIIGFIVNVVAGILVAISTR